jgi:hypothetical protein
MEIEGRDLPRLQELFPIHKDDRGHKTDMLTHPLANVRKFLETFG